MGRAELENARVAAVDSYQLVGRSRAEVLDSVTQVAAALFDVPMASVALVHRHVQWFAGRTGLAEPGTSRAGSFSDRLIGDPHTLVVPDTRHDPLYRYLPHVTRTPPIRFYAGVPLIDGDGHVLGAVSVFDREPRQAGTTQMRMLETLTAQTAAHLRTIRDSHRLSSLNAELDRRREQETNAVASVSHELRTPVAAMLGYLELLLEQPDLAPYRGLLEPIRQDGLRLIDKVERIVTAVQPGGTATLLHD